MCRRDGKAWSLNDFEGDVSGVTMLTVVADDNDRQAYLNRAKALLEQKQPVRTAAYPDTEQRITRARASMFSGIVTVEPERAPDGRVEIWLAPNVLAKLKMLRRPSECYSDVILALVGR